MTNRMAAPTVAFRLAAAVFTVAGVAACSSGGGPSSDPTTAESAQETGGDLEKAADETLCTADVQDKALQPPYGDGFPAEWPFPPDTVVYDYEDRGDAGVIVTAVSSAPFETVLDFMNGEVVSAGFEVERGETEENDAEAEWSSSDYYGRWAIRKSATCDGQTVIQVLAGQR